MTIGMRGDGAVAMGGGTDEENMAVLSDVIKGQREILGRVHGKDPAGIRNFGRCLRRYNGIMTKVSRCLMT